MARFDLTDFEWSVIQPLLPNKPRGVKRVDDRRVLNGIFWRLRTGGTLGGYSRALRSADDLLQPVCAVAQGRGLGSDIAFSIRGLRWQCPDDRLLFHSRSPACGERQKRGRSGCMGRSRGGLTTKIHALVDACGLPIDLTLSEGQAYDGHSAHGLLRHLEDGTMLLADRAYDADAIRSAATQRGGLGQYSADAATPPQACLQQISL